MSFFVNASIYESFKKEKKKAQRELVGENAILVFFQRDDSLMNTSPNICIVITHEHHVPRQSTVNKTRVILCEFCAASNFTVAHVVLLGSGGDNKIN